MCGIAGIFNLDGSPVDEKLLIRMRDTLLHRGPDDAGIFIDNNLGLAHRRLSILDLTDAGHQPMQYLDGRYTIVFNGEIYNYIELREELEKEGYRFRSRTDTEVILAAYDRWGKECVKRFNGMWAFAIWDRDRKTLFLSRDRLGIKPLFYSFRDGKIFLFASEIKSLLIHPNVPKVINRGIIYDYLVWVGVDYNDETFFEGINKLSPGTNILLNSRGINFDRYWKLDYNSHSICGGLDADDIFERFRELFFDSVRLRLRSDVPVGTCLSGGVDSSTIVMVANKLLIDEHLLDRSLVGKHQKTFSSCFDDPRFDERRYSDVVIKATGAERNWIFPKSDELLEEMDRLIYHQDEPVGGTSMYAQWNVFKLARRCGVKVVLDGQGSDEMLAGYAPYYRTFIIQLIREAHAGKFLHELPFYREHIKNNKRKLHIEFAFIGFTLLPNSLKNLLRDAFNPISLTGVIREDFARKHSIRFQHYLEQVNRRNLQTKLMQDTLFYSLPRLLRFEDRSSMAYSIESRLPFLDYRLVEFIFSLPAVFKINNGWTKYVLREAMRGILPDIIRERKDKMGFVTPQKIWLRDEMRDWIRDIFSDKNLRISEFVYQDKLKGYYEAFVEGKTYIPSANIWRLLNLELWLRRYFG